MDSFSKNNKVSQTLTTFPFRLDDWINISTEATPFRVAFDDVDIAIATIIIVLLLLFGVVANIITFLVVYRSKKLWSVFNIYIMSLCVSDFLSAGVSPFLLYQRTWGFDNWSLPEFCCTIYWAGDMATTIATTAHILAFCILRFLSIAAPHTFSRISIIHAKISIVCIWLVALLGGFLPYSIFAGVNKIDRTKEAINKAWPLCSVKVEWLAFFHRFSTYGYPIFLYFPLFATTVLTVVICIIMCSRRSKRISVNKSRNVARVNDMELSRQKKENQAIAQLLLIVASFILGYLPLSVFHTKIPNLDQSTHEKRHNVWWTGLGSYICLRFSECLNPIFYNLGSNKLRAKTLSFLRHLCRCKKDNDHEINERKNQIRTVSFQPVANRSTGNARTQSSF